MKKRIVLLHSENVYNYGTFMMVENLIHYLGNNFEYYLDVKSDEDLERVNNEVPGDFTIKRLKLSPKPKINNIIDNFKNVYVKNHLHIKEILYVKPDAVIVLGGDDLSEYYAGWKISIELSKFKYLSKKTRLFLVGQTMGPFYSWRKFFAKWSLRDTIVFLRDPDSYNYLKQNLSWENDLYRASDLAFLDLPMQDTRQKVLEKYNLQGKKYVTIIPSGLFKLYCSNRESYIKSWVKMLEGMKTLPELKGYTFVLLAHVLKPVHVDDRKIIEEMCDRVESIVKITDVLYPSEAREILGNGEFTITGRMHPAVSTYQKRKLAICFSYSIKYEGVIGNDVGRGDLVIESTDNDLWNTGEIANMLVEKVRYLLSKKDVLEVEVQKSMMNVEKRAIMQINKIREDMNNGYE